MKDKVITKKSFTKLKMRRNVQKRIKMPLSPLSSSDLVNSCKKKNKENS